MKLIKALLAASLFVGGHRRWPTRRRAIRSSTSTPAWRLRVRTASRSFVYFGRYGCAWCDHTNKKTFSDAALKKLYTENYVLVYVDAESGRNG
jgi:thioredoxin-related protein